MNEVRRVQPLPWHPADGGERSRLHQEEQDRQAKHCLLSKAHPDPTDGSNSTGDGIRTHPHHLSHCKRSCWKFLGVHG